MLIEGQERIHKLFKELQKERKIIHAYRPECKTRSSITYASFILQKPDGNNGCRLINGYEKSATNEDEDTKILEPKEELQYLSEVLGFQVTYTDFPQKNTSKKAEFITLVKLSTKPPKV